MKLNRVTFTGASDVAAIPQMLALSKFYPFIEWGILVPASRSHSRRFASRKFVDALPPELQLSLHICDPWANQLVEGVGFRFPNRILDKFQRVQVNTHGVAQTWTRPIHEKLGPYDRQNLCRKELIFQLDGVNDHAFVRSVKLGYRCSGLFDLSHGAGVTPAMWKRPLAEAPNASYGYAGGLGPKNLSEQLKRIEDAVGDAAIWVDMETALRTNDCFDFKKAEACAKIAEYLA